jgi:hypothetical protein
LVTGVSVVVEEITNRKRAEAALKNAHDELERRVAERTTHLQQANRELELLRLFAQSADQAFGISDDSANGFVIADGAKIELVDLAPTIGSLQGGPNPNITDARVNLRAADVADDDGEVVQVAFYRDVNGNGQLDPDDQLLATDTDGSDGWAANVSTSGFGSGNQRYFAQATDDQGLKSAPVAMTISTGTIAVMDNSQPGYAELGAGWSTDSSPGDYLGSHCEHSGGSAGEASWTIQNVRGGYYKIFVTYAPGENLASNTCFEIYDGQTLVSTVMVDQRAALNSEQDLGAWWRQLGSFVRINSGSITVKLKSDTTDGAVAADAIRLYDDPFAYIIFTDYSRDQNDIIIGANFLISLSQCENQTVTVHWQTGDMTGYNQGESGARADITIPIKCPIRWMSLPLIRFPSL